ncbi:4'-phosphopantetheinyl transferase [Streptomyces sp. LN785]|uniref:4'-phosphopantetheinyl transferase family protein n=1 Tax=Streptomyces sp. LN785 TaxID=3112983 RepID=UPI0037218842
MLGEILPAAVATVELYEDPPESWLYPEEEAYVSRAVESRRREFTTGRHCARAALARLGVPATAILKGERGAPCWPDGVVGSITHCAGYRAAAVARTADLVTVGIDAEPNEPLPAGILDTVSLPEERGRLTGLADALPEIAWDRLLFSAKESVYKAWFPLTGSWLGFEEADITVDPATDSFRARLLVPGPTVAGTEWYGFTGRYGVSDGLVVTAVTDGLRRT